MAFRRSLCMPNRYSQCPIIYVDDNADDHFVFHQATRRSQTPFHIQPFYSGEPALAYLRSQPPFDDGTVYPRPHLLLCDFNLGTTCGCDLVAAIRALPTCNTLPIIVFSDSQKPDTIAQSYAAGADCFLFKPGLCADLEIMVKTLYACAVAKNFASLLKLKGYRPPPVTIPSTFVAQSRATS